MKLKITVRNANLLEKHIKYVLNACVVLYAGNIPTQKTIDQPEIFGGYWFREQDKYEIYSLANNFKAFVKDEGKDYILLDFRIRYRNLKEPVLTQFLADWFEFCEVVHDKN